MTKTLRTPELYITDIYSLTSLLSGLCGKFSTPTGIWCDGLSVWVEQVDGGVDIGTVAKVYVGTGLSVGLPKPDELSIRITDR